MYKRPGILIVLLLLSGTSLPTHSHDGDTHQPKDNPVHQGQVLGSISFPTSTTSADAQASFVEGMLLLHLFEFDFARDKFQAARLQDPGFVMAGWAEAMTYNHPLWDSQDTEAGRAVLKNLAPDARQRSTLAGTSREQDFLNALEHLYGEGAKAERDVAYSRYMEQMARRYPDDHEVQLFYALSLMGLGSGVRDVPTYIRSAALSQQVFSRNPQHPGAAHYLIHGVDDPLHAPLGLDAARALALMAPDAGHSLHMTSHIFTALGMWDDVVSANIEAVRVANAMRATRGLPPRSSGHYNYWLLYGLLQQGRQQEARALLQAAFDETTAAKLVPETPMELDPDRSPVGSLVQMWARFIIETRSWDSELTQWQFTTADAFDPNLTVAYIHGMSAAVKGESAAAAQQLDKFRALRELLTTTIYQAEEQQATHLLYLERLAVLETELQAMLALARGNPEQAIERAVEASRLEGEMPYAFGPPYIDLPAAELLAELLLSQGQAQAAVEAFTLQLVRTREKALSLIGLGLANKAQGNQKEMAYARKTLDQLWHNADRSVKQQLEGLQ